MPSIGRPFPSDGSQADLPSIPVWPRVPSGPQGHPCPWPIRQEHGGWATPSRAPQPVCRCPAGLPEPRVRGQLGGAPRPLWAPSGSRRGMWLLPGRGLSSSALGAPLRELTPAEQPRAAQPDPRPHVPQSEDAPTASPETRRGPLCPRHPGCDPAGSEEWGPPVMMKLGYGRASLDSGLPDLPQPRGVKGAAGQGGGAARAAGA